MKIRKSRLNIKKSRRIVKTKKFKRKRINSKKRNYRKKLGGGNNIASQNYISLDEDLKKYKFNESKYNKDLISKYKGEKIEITKGASGEIFHLKNIKGKPIAILKVMSGGGDTTHFYNTFIKIKSLDLESRIKNDYKEKDENYVDIYSSSFFKKKIGDLSNGKISQIIPISKIRSSSTNPIRHGKIETYTSFHKYIDMLCCIYELNNKFVKPDITNNTVGNDKNNEFGFEGQLPNQKQNETINSGNQEITKKPKFNEVIIQRVLQKYIDKADNNSSIDTFLIKFLDFQIVNNVVSIVQEKLGGNQGTNLEEYINKNIGNKDLFSFILNDMLGIRKKKQRIVPSEFFESFKNFLNETDNKFIEDYLKEFHLNSFFHTMRQLFEHVGFLHLDFKLRNIFIRFNEVEGVEEFKKYSLVIADLDKARLRVPISTYYNIFS